MFLIVLLHRPDIVISTGAAPGFFALLFGKLLGARTIWIDSIANAEQLSVSGQKVKLFADLSADSVAAPRRRRWSFLPRSGDLIFVTVGTQLPFQRLVKAMDAWAGNHPGKEIFMQTGDTAYQPRHCAFKPYTLPDEWEDRFRRAALLVSHAGMGTILKSLDTGKPLILMPRLAALGEHRNDHQVATATRFGTFPTFELLAIGQSFLRHWTDLRLQLFLPPLRPAKTCINLSVRSENS